MAKIKFLIKPDGKVHVQVLEVKGKDCLRLTKPIETALGEVADKRITADYYEHDAGQIQQSETKKTISY